MIRILENAVLGSDIDFAGFSLLNCDAFTPTPSALVDTTDSRLSDKRPVLNGSVTDDSVAWNAAIAQSKLSLDGVIPVAWIGTASTQAAQGNLYQPVSLKDALNGYPGLDANGKIPVAKLPSTGPQAGTVTEVVLMLPQEFSLTGSPIQTNGTFTASWVNVPDNSWFGALFGKPQFLTEQIPPSLIPSLDGAKFGSGTFPVAMLPVALGMGVGHAQGIVPDPGDQGKGMPNDYLGRNMEWQHFDMDKTYQPSVPPVNIFVNSYISSIKAWITIRSMLAKSSLFYETVGMPDFAQVVTTEDDVHISFTANVGDGIKAYAARPGYNNSPINTFIVPAPPAPGG